MMTARMIGDTHVALDLTDGSRLLLPWPLPDPLPVMTAAQHAEVEAWVAAGSPLYGPTLEEAKATALARLADRRWQAETAGVAHAGHTWHTTQDGRVNIAGAVQAAAMFEGVHGAGTWSTDWKTVHGWASVDLATIQAAGLAVVAHIQACFAREKQIADAIEAAATVAAVQAIDLEEGWPT